MPLVGSETHSSRKVILIIVGVLVLGGAAFGAYKLLNQPVPVAGVQPKVSETNTPSPLATPEATEISTPTPTPTLAPTAAPATSTPKPATPAPTAKPTAAPAPTPIIFIVTFTGSAYSPNTVSIKAGDTVKFVNTSNSDNMWPASNPHPSHTGYPGFDPIGLVGPGATWSFTFNNKGNWGYHDHLNSSITGTVNVN